MAKNSDKKSSCPSFSTKENKNTSNEWGLTTWITYSSVSVLILSYCVFLYDRDIFKEKSHVPGISQLETLFDAIEKYSPFHEFLLDDYYELKEKLKAKSENDIKSVMNDESKVSDNIERLITPEELKKYDGTEGSPGLYIAILGQVFDVSKGKDHYGPGGGYSFFAGKDGSRAFVTGDFNEEGLIDDLTGLDTESYLGLDDWVKFYRKDYTYAGKLTGRYYEPKTGVPTKYYHQLEASISDAKAKKAEKESDRKIFPPCNSEWSQDKGHRVWCTKLSGGVKRNWVGVPRKLFMPGQNERCACIKDYGDSISGYDGGNKDKRGDLGHPNLKEYEGCDPKADSCQLS